jgi:hypothetical protein
MFDVTTVVTTDETTVVTTDETRRRRVDRGLQSLDKKVTSKRPFPSLVTLV